jgi:hypothetical protein
MRAARRPIEERTALLNGIRGLLVELGVWIGRSSSVLVRRLSGSVARTSSVAVVRYEPGV